jgi:hypothetical protein
MSLSILATLGFTKVGEARIYVDAPGGGSGGAATPT